MHNVGFYLVFPTVAGPAGLAWQGDAVVRVVLPEANEQKVRRHFDGSFTECPAAKVPGWVNDLCRELRLHIRGGKADYSRVRIADGELPPFHRRVYRAARRIRSGEIRSYGELAKKIGAPGAARAVGQAMARNPVPLIVPCHRVLRSDGGLGGFSASTGVAFKRRLLRQEGVCLED